MGDFCWSLRCRAARAPPACPVFLFGTARAYGGRRRRAWVWGVAVGAWLGLVFGVGVSETVGVWSGLVLGVGLSVGAVVVSGRTVMVVGCLVGLV